MNPSKALKKFNSLADVEFQSRTQNRLLVVYEEIVYDLTTFSSRHPGGAAAIMDHKGKVIDNVIFNPSYYKHNPRILDKMTQFKVGFIEPPAAQKANQPSKIVPQQQIKPVSSNAGKDTQLQKNPPNQLKSQQQAAVQNKPENQQQQQQPQQIAKRQLTQQQQQQQAKQEAEKLHMLQKQQQQQLQQQSAKHNSQYQISSSSSAVQQQPQLKQTQSQPSSQQLVKGQQQQSQISSSMKLQQQQSQQPPSRERESSLGKKLAEELIADQAIKTNPTSNTNTHNNNMQTSIHLEDNDQKDKLNVSKTTKMSITSDRSIKGVKDFLMNAEQHRLPSTIPDLNQLQILSNKSIPHPEDSNTPTNSLLKDIATPKLSNYYSSEAHKAINADNMTDGFKLTNLNDPFEDYYDLDVPNDEIIRIDALPPLLPTIFFHRRH